MGRGKKKKQANGTIRQTIKAGTGTLIYCLVYYFNWLLLTADEKLARRQSCSKTWTTHSLGKKRKRDSCEEGIALPIVAAKAHARAVSRYCRNRMLRAALTLSFDVVSVVTVPVVL